ncbi:MAG: hypothetical protein KAI43_06225 [Candidatus Aureabacteria bacterium]|nr:hypothetical protein [Candidatus Auribacterota bacterium]
MVIGTHYVSGSLFFYARKSIERAKNGDEHESIPSILLSTIGFESFCNEMIEITLSQLKEPSDKIKEQFNEITSRTCKIRDKYKILYRILSNKSIDASSSIYDDFILLFDLRNELIHRKPEKCEWDPNDPERTYSVHPLIKRFVTKNIIPKPHPNNPTGWFQYVNDSKVAKWALDTVILNSKYICENISDENYKKFILKIYEYTLKP